MSADKQFEENYDPNKPVCDNQDDFNMALRKALKYNEKQDMKKAKPWVAVYLVLWLIFFIWAIILAMKVAPGPERVEHLIFAMVFSPVYVLAHYLGVMKDNGMMGFRGGGCGMGFGGGCGASSSSW